ncbi:MAG: sigma-70 family RNA polymerase sigma factor [Bacteroidaceae bacterium]|nr:sigma-70 family RNA polymerase sigma factor [Bacteroidaceae bacterium]
MEAKEQDFTAIVEEYRETIQTICLMYARDREEAEDMMQEALVNLWKARETFRGESRVRTWVWRICVNSCVSYARKYRPSGEERPFDLSGLVAEGEDDELIRQLHDRIHRLRPFDRALVLLWMEDLSYQEIGEILGITAHNVGTRLYRIKEQLRRMSNNKETE